MSQVFMRIWWYPNLRSSLVNISDPWSSSNNFLMVGMTFLLGIVALFKALQSTQNLQGQSFIFTKIIGLEKGLVEGYMTPTLSISQTIISITFFYIWGYQKDLTFMGLVPSSRVIWCSEFFVRQVKNRLEDVWVMQYVFLWF